jgi:hypothetical protein
MREATVRCVAAVCKTAPYGQTPQVQLLPRMPTPRSPTAEASVLRTDECRCNPCRGDFWGRRGKAQTRTLGDLVPLRGRGG